MAVEFNHTIVGSRDKRVAATFMADLLGLPEPTAYGPFMVLQLDNGVSLDYLEHDGDIASAHFEDPNGHNMEVLTRPYGSGSSD